MSRMSRNEQLMENALIAVERDENIELYIDTEIKKGNATESDREFLKAVYEMARIVSYIAGRRGNE